MLGSYQLGIFHPAGRRSPAAYKKLPLACAALFPLVCLLVNGMHHIVYSGNKRVIIVGDIHGCIHELKVLLKKCLFRRSEDLLVRKRIVFDHPPPASPRLW